MASSLGSPAFSTQILDASFYGWVGDNATDNYANGAMTNLTAAMKSKFGIVYFQPGKYLFSQPWVLDTQALLRIIGAGSNQAGAGIATTLIYTGQSVTGAASGAISLRSSRGVKLEGLGIEYNQSGFAGFLLDYGAQVSGGGSTVNCCIEDCNIRPTSDTFNLAAGLVHLGNVSNFTCSRSILRGGQYNVIGRVGLSGFNNSVKFDECNFANGSSGGVKNFQQSWEFSSCVWEPLSSGQAGAITYDPGLAGDGLTVINPWIGDDHAAVSGIWFNIGGNAFTLVGGYVGVEQSTTAINWSANSANGMNVHGTFFQGFGGGSTIFNFTSGNNGFFSFGCDPTNYGNLIVGQVPTGSLYSFGGTTNYGAINCSTLASSGLATVNTLAVTGAPAQPNLLTAIEADFETNGFPTGWAANANAVISTTTAAALHGTHSLNVVTASSGGTETSVNLFNGKISTSPGESWTALGSFLCAPASTPRLLQIDIDTVNLSGTNGTRIATTGNIKRDNTATWTPLNVTGSVNSGAAYVYLTIRWSDVVSITSGENHYLDCVSLSHSTSTTWQDPAAGTSAVVVNGQIIQQQGTAGSNDIYLLGQSGGSVYLNRGPAAGTGGVTIGGHLVLPDGAPTLTLGSGAGTGATVGYSGSDEVGTISITTGAGALPNSNVVSVAYGTSYPTIPRAVNITPSNINAWALTGGSYVGEDATQRTVSGYVLGVGASGLASGVQYIWTSQTIG